MTYGLHHIKRDAPEQVFQCGTDVNVMTLEGIDAQAAQLGSSSVDSLEKFVPCQGTKTRGVPPGEQWLVQRWVVDCKVIQKAAWGSETPDC